MNSRDSRITAEDFKRMFGLHVKDLSEEFLSAITKVNTAYRNPNQEEFEEYVLTVLKLIDSSGISRNTTENFQAWEKGWQENLESVAADEVSLKNLRPKYFRPSKFLRYNQGLIVSDNLNLEYDLFNLARHLIFKKYLTAFDDVYEFGCGSCQNLFLLSEIFPQKKLHGLDWAKPSMEIIKLLAEKKKINVQGTLFDMLNPPRNLTLKANSAFLTVHSLEQIGNQHDKFIAFIMSHKPGIVINYEPILEFYDQNNLLDYLALTYSQKRNYLRGFWTALSKLKENRKIEIIDSRRPFLGGVIHEASLIVWRPL